MSFLPVSVKGGGHTWYITYGHVALRERIAIEAVVTDSHAEHSE